MGNGNGKGMGKRTVKSILKVVPNSGATCVLVFGGATSKAKDYAFFAEFLKKRLGKLDKVFVTAPGDLSLGKWYSEYLPLEADIAYNLERGWDPEGAKNEATNYSHTVLHRDWEGPTLAWAKESLLLHGPVSKLILIGFSNGAMVASHIAKAMAHLQPRLWLASGPPAAFQLDDGSYARAPVKTVLTVGGQEKYWGGAARIRWLSALFNPTHIEFPGRHCQEERCEWVVDQAMDALLG